MIYFKKLFWVLTYEKQKFEYLCGLQTSWLTRLLSNELSA